MGDNVDVLASLPDESFRMIYIDPPFNTGRTQTRKTLKTTRSVTGQELGSRASPMRQSAEKLHPMTTSSLTIGRSWSHAWRKLGDYWLTTVPYICISIIVKVHYAKVLLDALFGRESFLNDRSYGATYGSNWR